MAAVTQVRILVTADFCLLLGDFPQCTFLFLSSSKKKAVFSFAGPPTTILQSLTDILHSFSWESILHLFSLAFSVTVLLMPPSSEFFFFSSMMQQTFQINLKTLHPQTHTSIKVLGKDKSC